MAIPIEVQNTVQEIELNVASSTNIPIEAGTTTPHNHDERYYTEAETDALLSGKSNVGHNHDDRYYTESEIDNALSAKQNTIDGSNKLSADFVSDGSTNKVVSQTEKNTWNGKADINDSSTSSDKVWSASKVNSLVGNVESLLEALL